MRHKQFNTRETYRIWSRLIRDALYLSEPGEKIRFGGHFYMGKTPAHSTTTNGPVLKTASILCNIVSSAVEAEYGGMFMNDKDALPLHQDLIEMGHK